jgi:hypothetical protein
MTSLNKSWKKQDEERKEGRQMLGVAKAGAYW